MKTFGNLGSPSIFPSVNLSHFFPSFFPFASKPPVSGNKRPLTGDDPPNFAIVLSFSFSLSPVPNCMPFNAQFHRQNTRKVSTRKGSNYIVDQPSEDCQRIDNSFGWKEGRKPNSGATGSSTLTPRSRVEGIFNIDQDSLFPTSRFCAIARDTTSKHPRSSARRMATRHISLGSTSREIHSAMSASIAFVDEIPIPSAAKSLLFFPSPTERYGKLSSIAFQPERTKRE